MQAELQPALTQVGLDSRAGKARTRSWISRPTLEQDCASRCSTFCLVPGGRGGGDRGNVDLGAKKERHPKRPRAGAVRTDDTSELQQSYSREPCTAPPTMQTARHGQFEDVKYHSTIVLSEGSFGSACQPVG